MQKVPLRIDFKMGGPVQMDNIPIHFDGLLTYALLEERSAQFTQGKIDKSPNPADLSDPIYSSLPLDSQQGVYCASVLIPVVTSHISTRFFTRNNDAESLAMFAIEDKATGVSPLKNAKNLGLINSTSGELKSHFITSGLSHFQTMQAFCIGDPEQIETLLSDHIFAIGKNRAKGFGKITSIKVVEDQKALTMWKLRAMPSPQGNDAPVAMPVRAPYWNKSLIKVSYLPVSVL